MYITDTGGTQREFYGFAGPDANKHKVVYDAKKLYVDDVLAADNSSYSFGNTPYNFSLFNARNSTGYEAKTKIYEFKMWKSGQLVRNYIPVMKTETKEIGLLDLVNNKFYANEGTGVFLAGPLKEKTTSNSKVLVNDNHTLKANWIRSCMVMFDANGGSVSSNSKQVTDANNYGDLPTPTRGGYTFLGWRLTGKNLYNLDIYSNNYLDASGNLVSSSRNYLSDYIPISSLKTYVVSTNQVISNIGYILYDNNKNVVIRTNNFDTNSVVINPSNDGYIRLWFDIDGNDNTLLTPEIISNYEIQFEEGNNRIVYESYYVTSSTKVTQTKNHTLRAIWKQN